MPHVGDKAKIQYIKDQPGYFSSSFHRNTKQPLYLINIRDYSVISPLAQSYFKTPIIVAWKARMNRLSGLWKIDFTCIRQKLFESKETASCLSQCSYKILISKPGQVVRMGQMTRQIKNILKQKLMLKIEARIQLAILAFQLQEKLIFQLPNRYSFGNFIPTVVGEIDRLTNPLQPQDGCGSYSSFYLSDLPLPLLNRSVMEL